MFINVQLQEPTNATDSSNQEELSKPVRAFLALAIALLSIGLAYVLWLSNRATPDLAANALNQLSVSGVENPVTAVLLNFRSYDTLLEIAVLLIVATAIQGSDLHQPSKTPIQNPVLEGLLRWLVPLALLLGGYLLWAGAASPGGAFQAASVIAGAGVAVSLAGSHHFDWHSVRMRWVLVSGLLMFIAVAALCAGLTGTAFQYPVDFAGSLILMIEVAATISISAILLLLFTELKGLPSEHVSNSSAVKREVKHEP